MRIIAGKYRGRRLRPVPGKRTRPTGDRVREALFSVLGETVSGSRVLDLFAGTGALGLEALSRGAARAVMVESDPGARAAIEANIAALGAGNSVRLHPAAFPAALELLSAAGEDFDIVLADPPYRSGVGENLLDELAGFAILAPGGVAVIEHPPAAGPVPPGPGWRILRRKQYGRTVLSFYHRLPGDPGRSEVPGVSEASDASEPTV